MLKRSIAALLTAQTLQVWALHTGVPSTLSDPRIDSHLPRAVINDQGHAAIAWIAETHQEKAVYAAYRTGEAGNWSTPRQISEWQYDITDLRSHMDSSGKVSALWEIEPEQGAPHYLQLACKPFSEDWSQAVDLFSTPLDSVPAEHTVFEPDGQVMAIRERTQEARYLGLLPKRYLIETASVPSDSEAGYTVLQSLPKFLWSHGVATHPQGLAFLFWQSYECFLWLGCHNIISGSWRTDANQWTAPETVYYTEDYVFCPQVAVGLNGCACIVWEPAFKDQNMIRAVVHSKKGWSEIVTLSSADDEAINPKVAVDAAGNALAAWEVKRGKYTIVCAAYKLFGKPWSPSFDVSLPGRDATGPILACDEAGHFILVWQEYSRRFPTIWGSQLSTVDGLFSEAVLLSPEGLASREPSVAFAGTRGILSWIATSNTLDQFVQAADLIVD